MYDQDLLSQLVEQVEESIRRVERRSANIHASEDFIQSDEGLDLLDSIAMMLISIGENIKNTDKITDGKILSKYPEIH
ncbi:MAG: hypothetical protein L6Q54_15700 [Leptospiraceae bacterium]|nr:hypothetical protein [Leptospiraceae bacterium]